MDEREDEEEVRADFMLPPPPPRREAHDLLGIGTRVTHPKRGAGTLKDIFADGRRVIGFADSATPRRYNVHSLHKLVSSETKAMQAKLLEVGWLDKVADVDNLPQGCKQPHACAAWIEIDIYRRVVDRWMLWSGRFASVVCGGLGACAAGVC